MRIAIDGPAGSGKSTLAKLLAESLGIKYLDTGAMYRAVTLAALRDGVRIDRNEEALGRLAQSVALDFNGARILLNGEDVSEAIRGPDVTQNVSEVSASPEVREEMTRRQHEFAEGGDVVMDGRDIGTVVMPDADFKFYLDASPECRAARRALDMSVDSGDPRVMEELVEAIVVRDRKDSEREVSPLKRAEDAHWILTDDYSVPEVLGMLLDVVKGG